MKAVIHCSPHYCRSRSPIMCSFHCVSSSFSFYSSVRIFFFFYISPSLLLSHSFSLSVLLLTRFWLGLLLLLKPSHIFFVPLFEKWLSALSHQLSGQQKDTITGTQIEPALLLFYLRCHRLNVVHIPFCNACVLGITGSCNVGS